MYPKTFAAFLILSAFTAVSAGSALAQGTGFKGNGFNGGDGGHFNSRGNGFHGRGNHGRGVGVWGLVDDYGYDGDSGPDWYGISSGYDPCPLFRQRVRTPDGWRVKMVPVC
jgi:hypothetical protein